MNSSLSNRIPYYILNKIHEFNGTDKKHCNGCDRHVFKSFCDECDECDEFKCEDCDLMFGRTCLKCCLLKAYCCDHNVLYTNEHINCKVYYVIDLNIKYCNHCCITTNIKRCELCDDHVCETCEADCLMSDEVYDM